MLNVMKMASVVGLLLLSAGRGAAEEKQGLRELAAEMAASVTRAVKTNKVRIGLFTPSGFDHSFGGGSLTVELAIVLGTQVDPASTLELKGDVFYLPDPTNAAFKVFKVKAKLTDTDKGEDLKEFPTFEGFVRSNTDINRITGAIASHKTDEEYKVPPSQGRNEDRQNGLPSSSGKPPKQQAFVEKGTLVRTSEKGKYAVEILSGKELLGTFKPLPVRMDDAKLPGLPVVSINQGEYYRVRVKNDDSVEIAVFLHLDGIDQFTFSENRAKDGRPQFSSWIVEPGKEIVIMGWHKNVGTEEKTGEVFGFLTTKAGEGVASKFPTISQGKVGTICVSIAYAKPLGTRSAKGDELETTVGAPIKVAQKAVQRSIAEPHEFITVRYGR